MTTQTSLIRSPPIARSATSSRSPIIATGGVCAPAGFPPNLRRLLLAAGVAHPLSPATASAADAPPLDLLVLLLALGLASPGPRRDLPAGRSSGHLRGSLSPHNCRADTARAVRVIVATRIAATHGGPPPQLRRIAISINRHGHLSSRGLPLCHLADIQPSTTAESLRACRDSLVGQGASPPGSCPRAVPLPLRRQGLRLQRRLPRRPSHPRSCLRHQPGPNLLHDPLRISKPRRGSFGTVLAAALPDVTGDSGYITGLSLDPGAASATAVSAAAISPPAARRRPAFTSPSFASPAPASALPAASASSRP